MMKLTPAATVFAMSLAMSVAACGKDNSDTGYETPATGTQTPEATPEPAAPEETLQIPQAATGQLIPPAPGEPGGLPDDRTPLDESRIDPESIRGAGLVLEQYGIALEQGAYFDAYGLWANDGAASGMTDEDFATSLMKYSEIHVLIGRPEANGDDLHAIAPVQMYGRMNDGSTFNTIGPVLLERADTGGSVPWVITDSALKPLGEVRIVPTE